MSGPMREEWTGGLRNTHENELHNLYFLPAFRHIRKIAKSNY